MDMIKRNFINNQIRCFVCIVFFSLFAYPSLAGTVLDITRGTDEPLPIAIVDFEHG